MESWPILMRIQSIPVDSAKQKESNWYLQLEKYLTILCCIQMRFQEQEVSSYRCLYTSFLHVYRSTTWLHAWECDSLLHEWACRGLKYNNVYNVMFELHWEIANLWVFSLECRTIILLSAHTVNLYCYSTILHGHAQVILTPWFEIE